MNSKARAKMADIVNRSIKLNYSRSRSKFFLELNRAINRVNGLRQVLELMLRLVSFFPGNKTVPFGFFGQTYIQTVHNKNVPCDAFAVTRDLYIQGRVRFRGRLLPKGFVAYSQKIDNQ